MSSVICEERGKKSESVIKKATGDFFLDWDAKQNKLGNWVKSNAQLSFLWWSERGETIRENIKLREGSIKNPVSVAADVKSTQMFREELRNRGIIQLIFPCLFCQFWLANFAKFENYTERIHSINAK